jgi:cobalt/nickel transport system permease protein
MHIPDGFLAPKTFTGFWGVSMITLGYAIKKTTKKLEDRSIPLLGVTAAFIFAAQMLNFPVAGGTSGHFMGGVLACILLGPCCGLLVMATVLTIQCIVFQDGGLTALGANIFNMGIIGSLVAYYIYTGLKKIIPDMIACFISAWLSIVLSAICCAIELAMSGIVPLKICVLSMAGWHALIGIGEGMITVGVISFIKKVRCDLLELEKV